MARNLSAAESRILHVVGDLGFGGVENWLLNVLRLKTRANLRMDLAATGEIDPRVRAKFESLGARVFPCPNTWRPLEIARNLSRLLREHGPYQLMHCHLHRGNGHLALVGRICGVPRIVVHSHLNSPPQGDPVGARMRLKIWLAGFLQKVIADVGLACCQTAGDSLFDPGWRTRENWRVLHCGIDLAPFERVVDRTALRAKLGIPEDAFVIGHVGRCEPVKNHGFILELAARYTAVNAEARFFLVGGGRLLPDLERRAHEIGRGDRIRLAGPRDDVPDLLLGVFDALILPSLSEGLPIALLEAQAAGLPVVVSESIPKEALIVPGFQVVGLNQPLEDWCAALDRARGARLEPARAIRLLEAAGHSVDDSVTALEQLYNNLSGSAVSAP